jgi:HK97 family phage prohead protease
MWADSVENGNEEASARGITHKTHTGEINGTEFVLSDDTPDRMGDIIEAGGWELEHFAKNPIALFNHHPDFIVGRWRNLRVEGNALRGHLELAPKGTSARINEIRKLVEAGILKAVSVGFRPLDYAPINPKEIFGGARFTKQELVETSLVAVPANPNALAVAKSLNVSPATIDLVFAKPGRTNVVARRGFTGKPAATHHSSKDNPMTGMLATRIPDSRAAVGALSG